MSKIAIMGHGVVGSGTVEVFYKNKALITKKCGQDVDIKYILDLRDFPESPYKEKFTKDFNEILNDKEVTVVVEAMGGLKPAYDFVKALLTSGKSVVTSNKELVATSGAELLRIARDSNVNFFFEASVGGGIPIIRPLYQCLSTDRIVEISGILNGTTNYILTKMIKDGISFEVALKNAQALGYAEHNPSADVEGTDTCRKICILGSIAFGKHIYPDSVHTEGITAITLEDATYAANIGYSIKLIGRATKVKETVAVMVCPEFVPNDNQLATVNDVFNAILVRGESTGDVIFYGKGAGRLPTASAVVTDITEAIKSENTSKSLLWEDVSESYVKNYLELQNKFYVRTSTENVGLIKSQVGKLFGTVTYLSRKASPDSELAFITNGCIESDFLKALDTLRKDATILNYIRVQK